MSTTVDLTRPVKGEGFRGGLRRRLALTGWSVVYICLAVPAVVLLCALTAGLGVAVVGVGLLVLLVFVPLTAQLTNVHRRVSGRILGQRIESPYVRGHGGPRAALARWAGDPARWRDFAWTYVSVCIGWAMAWLGLGLALAVVWYAIFPFLFAITPDGTFDTDYGLFVLDTQAEAFLEWVLMLVAFGLWWGLEPLVVRWRALLDRVLLSPSRGALERRVAEVSQSRAETIDHSAAELRRIERDLHDGAQARLVALGMNLGLAEELIDKDPEAAGRLLAEARTVTTSALGDLRSVVRGIHPPVLADRGLAGAVQALALDMPLPVAVTIVLPGRPPAPVESAAYFATSELLANIGKHSGARRASIDVSHDGHVLKVVVEDDGAGGASPERGSGLAGVARRLSAFDGTMDLVSPAGGPTVVTLEIPCALSSPKTSPSSGTA
ncbi:sensor histidine kinase [Aeromicrobium chenweiae]|uniref:histidine kinase n=1 Tax=Aeromicrobium chenweiae TaxID=2079793 RepID=A0A2S0WIN1_9ACTN|nr:histidine kinase [Aeromicrobium chenweiae]AWB91090.1 sensor histidine kinase [Aeromicrobium chenweiae]TGN31993.1 sensor histidine kinase [Aeromicrobium chenweiae]